MIVNEVMSTFCPAVMVGASKITSVPDVPAVNPVTTSVPPDEVLILAAAGVPVASALVSDLGQSCA